MRLPPRERGLAGAHDLDERELRARGLWMSAVPPSPVPSTRAVGVGDERVRLRVAAVDAEEERAHERLGRLEPVGKVVAVRCRERVVELLGELDLAHERVRGRARGCRRDGSPFHAVSAASAWYSPSISTSPRTWRGSGRDGITSMPPAWQRPSTSTTRSSGKPGQRAARVRHVDRVHLVLVVEDRVHHVDRELELVDAAA